MNNRIGVYICHCGSNISDVVDVQKVKETVAAIPGVIKTETLMFACADSSQKQIIADIIDNQLDGLVIASCSPKLHLFTFRSVAERAGLNYHQYVQVNIREQGSWAHGDKPGDATAKAIRLISAGIARVKRAEPLTPVEIAARDSVLIIGAGVAGMRSAIELADMGMYVYLIEKKHFTGGHVAQWDKLFMGADIGHEITARLYEEVKKRDKIQLFTGAEIISKAGSIGDYSLTIRITPRYVNKPMEKKTFQRLVEICPSEIKDEFSSGLSSRKAFYRNGDNARPSLPAIDRENCKVECHDCAKIFDGIDLNSSTEEINIQCGSILLCTGFDHYSPGTGEYGYGEIENVITLPQFKELAELSGDKLQFNGKSIKNIAYIYCVGSRQEEGDNKYCSRFCCSSAIHSALLVKEKFPEVNNFHFNRGIRTYGKHEPMYQQSCAGGDVYLQFNEDNPVTVIRNGKDNTIVKVNDLLTAGQELELEADLVVLVTGMIPAENTRVADILKVPVGRDKFYNEVHPKLRPVETVLDGIYIAGCCQGPKTITESVKSSLAAASKIFSLLGKRKLSIEPTQARINQSKCEWCGNCKDACPFNAVEKIMLEGKYIASVNTAVCKGCGMCLPVCEPNAIDLVGYSDVEIESMIEALVD